MKRPINFPGNFEAAKLGDVQVQMTQLAKERDEAANLAAAKEQVIAAHAKTLDDNNMQINRLATEKANTEKLLADREKALSAKDQQLASVVQQKDQQFNQIKTERDSIARSLSEKDMQISTLSGQLKNLQQADVSKAALLTEKAQLSTRVIDLEKTLQGRDAIISTHLKEIEKLRQQPPIGPAGGLPGAGIAAPKIVPMATTMSSIGAQIADAQTQLKTNNNFALSNIAVTLKAKVDSDNGTLKFFDPRDSIAADAMDSFTFNLDTGGSGDADTKKETVPDLAGLTMSAANRMLATVGLRFDAATGMSPKSIICASGQAYRQSPAAGTKVDRGTVVMVIFQQ